MKTMLFVFAHPDDESFMCGLTIPKYVKEGWKVHLLCATRGEAGSPGLKGYVTPEALGVIRAQELEKAAAILGIASVTFLDYRDATLKDLPAGEMEDKLYKKMTSLAPQIVVTMEPDGVTNHPDHIKLSLAATYAYQKYAKSLLDARAFMEAVRAKTPGIKRRYMNKRFIQEFRERAFIDTLGESDEPKLYYAAVPQSTVDFLHKQKALPKESFGKPRIGVADKRITTVIDGAEYTETKIRALAVHETQRKDVEEFVSVDSQPLARREYFILRMHGMHEVFMGKTDEVASSL